MRTCCDQLTESMPEKTRVAEVALDTANGLDGSDTSSVGSASTSTADAASIRGAGSTRSRRRRRRGRYKTSTTTAAAQTVDYRCRAHVREDHGQPLFSVQFSQQVRATGVHVLATCGGARVSVYELSATSCTGTARTTAGGDTTSEAAPQQQQHPLRLVHSYGDPDPDENFYTCAWSYDEDSGRPLIAAAGARGVIRLICTHQMQCVRHFIGHGHAVNELKFHPRKPSILLSVSKDHSLRLWNTRSGCCVAVLGGVDGHRDEALSADFNVAGDMVVSCGMDHSLKLWDLSGDKLRGAIDDSYNSELGHCFPTVEMHFPAFSTRDIHRNYVDCVRWFGKFILSKSCENAIVCWKPGLLSQQSLKPSDTNVTIIHMFDYSDCDIWFMRFSMDYWQMVLALGNQVGRLYVWDLAVNDPALATCSVLTHPKCNAAIRQTAVSPDGSTIVSVCDDATIWRWDRT